MESAGPSNKSENEEVTYMEQEAKKVRIYINELRERLAELKTEGEEIERTTETILGDTVMNPTDDEPEADATASIEAENILMPPVGAVISEAAGFTSLLRKFEDMKNEVNVPSPPREEPEEIRWLRAQNGSIREKIKQIQSRIERAQMSNSFHPANNLSSETIYENETCSQLYEAAANTLKKVDAIEAEILSVESFFKSKNSQHSIEMKKDQKTKTTNY